MSTRRAKQFIYGAFYAVIWILVIWIGYSWFAKPAPSSVCTLDCGAANAQAVAAGSLENFMTSPGHVTFLEQLTNPNAALAAQTLDYSVDIYNASDTLIYSIPGQTFLYPGEVKYVVLPNQILGQPFDHAVFTVKDVQWVTASNVGGAAPKFSFQNIQGVVASATVSVSGQIKNGDVSSFASILVVTIFKAADGTPIGASQTEIDNFSANATQNFTVIYPNVPGIDPTKNQVYAYALRT